MEEANKERASKEVSKSTLWEQTNNLATAERRFVEAERARVVVEKRVAYLEG